jgi:hypothetical protein
VRYRINFVRRSSDCLEPNSADSFCQLNAKSSSTQAWEIFDGRSCAVYGMPHASRRTRQSRQLSSVARRACLDRSSAPGSKLGTTGATAGWFCCLHRQRRRGNPGERARGKWRDYPSADAYLPFKSSRCDGHHRLPKIRAHDNALKLRLLNFRANPKNHIPIRQSARNELARPFLESVSFNVGRFSAQA